MGRRLTPRRALAGLLVAALLAGSAGGTTAPRDTTAGDAPGPESAPAERWNLYTPTPTPTAGPYGPTPTRPRTPTRTPTPTPTPYCTGPGCDGTPATEPPTPTPTGDLDARLSPTSSPERGGWTALLRPLLAFLAVATVGLLAVGAMLARWRLESDDGT